MCEYKKVDALRVSEVCDPIKEVDLLLISNDTTKHYCLIKNFSRLMTAQTGGNNTLHYCRRCLNSFKEIKYLDKHIEYCKEQNAVRIELPKRGAMLRFKNDNRSITVTFIVYADFE